MVQQFKLNEAQRDAIQQAQWEVSDYLLENWAAEDGDYDERGYIEILSEKDAFQDLIFQVQKQFHSTAKQEKFLVPAKYVKPLNEQIESVAGYSLNIDNDITFAELIVSTPAFQEMISDVIFDAYIASETEKEKGEA